MNQPLGNIRIVGVIFVLSMDCQFLNTFRKKV